MVLVVEFKFSNMWSQFVQVGQLHIVAIDMAQMGIGISRNRQLMSFKVMSCQWEYLLFVTGVMERDTHTAGDSLER